MVSETIGFWNTPKRFRKNPNRVRKYVCWPQDEREICQKCDKFLQEVTGKPMRVRGWLRGGIDTERMLSLKAYYENRRN
jgi:hypothetical protein